MFKGQILIPNVDSACKCGVWGLEVLPFVSGFFALFRHCHCPVAPDQASITFKATLPAVLTRPIGTALPHRTSVLLDAVALHGAFESGASRMILSAVSTSHHRA